MAKNNIINLIFFGEEIGRIGFDKNQNRSSFQYNPEYLNKPDFLNIFPDTGIIKRVPQPQIFKKFNNETFKGLPPQIADSLPDMFGNLIFKIWLDANRNNKKGLTIIEQLAYISNRGMGALEYFPSKDFPKNTSINLDEIIAILKLVLDSKTNIKEQKLNTEALLNIFKIGTSAGGARPKILISENKKTGKIIPGDVAYSDEYHHYLVKLALEDKSTYKREIIEYCYYLAAKSAGINMMESKLIDNKHFATLRFDRQNGEKQHVLTASGMTGWDFKKSENSSYENLFKLSSFLKLPHSQLEELYKRMIFNIVFKNTDDHLKNHAYLFDRHKNLWSLSPAYDLTYSLNPFIDFKVSNRALSVNDKRNDINLKDVLNIAEKFTIKNPIGIIKAVHDSIPVLAENMEKNKISTKVARIIRNKIQPL